MTTTAPWFRLFAAEFQSQTSSMKAIEKGVYITLLIAMHETGKPVADDTRRLARRSGTTVKAFEGALTALIEAGLILKSAAGLWSPAAQRETENRASKSKSAQENASMRWEKAQRNQRQKNTPVGKSQSQISDSEREALNELHASDSAELTGHRSTSKVVGQEETRLDGASSNHRIVYRIDDDIDVPRYGPCTCIDDSSVNQVKVRCHSTGDVIDVEILADGRPRAMEDLSWMEESFEEDDDAA